MTPRIFLLLALVGTLRAAEPPVLRPEPRSRAEVERALRDSAPPPAAPAPLRILLVAGPKDHGVGQHDYPAWQKSWAPYLGRAPNVRVDTAFPWPRPEQWDAADVAVLYLHPAWDAAQLADVRRFQERGRGVALLHWAIGSDRTAAELAGRTGIAYPSTRYRHGVVRLHLAPGDPLTQGLPATLSFSDEVYWPLLGDRARVNVVAYSEEAMDGAPPAPLPVFWTYRAGPGRAFVSICGHFMWTFDDPYFRLLALRGISWAAGQPVTRLDGLALDGAAVR